MLASMRMDALPAACAVSPAAHSLDEVRHCTLSSLNNKCSGLVRQILQQQVL